MKLAPNTYELFSRQRGKMVSSKLDVKHRGNV